MYLISIYARFDLTVRFAGEHKHPKLSSHQTHVAPSIKSLSSYLKESFSPHASPSSPNWKTLRTGIAYRLSHLSTNNRALRPGSLEPELSAGQSRSVVRGAYREERYLEQGLPGLPLWFLDADLGKTRYRLVESGFWGTRDEILDV